MNKTIYFIALTFLVILEACTKETITTVSSDNIPVVEAFLEPGKEVYVKLSKMIPFSEDEYTEPLVIDTAKVYINYHGLDYLLTPIAAEPGKYENTNPELISVAGGVYNLRFFFNGYSVISTTSIPTKPINLALSFNTLYVDTTITGPGSTNTVPMTVSWDNPENSYHLIIVEYMDSIYNPISDNLSADNFNQFRKVSTDPVLETSYDLNTRQQLVFFGEYRVIVYKINEEYVNLYENISQSSLNLTEPITNIENGLGIFTGMNSDTLFLDVKEL